MYSAQAYGIDNVRLIAVWDVKNEPSTDLDSRLVRHMVELMQDAGGRIEQIHPGKLSRFTTEKNSPPEKRSAGVAVRSTPRLEGKAPRKVSKKN